MWNKNNVLWLANLFGQSENLYTYHVYNLHGFDGKALIWYYYVAQLTEHILSIRCVVKKLFKIDKKKKISHYSVILLKIMYYSIDKNDNISM